MATATVDSSGTTNTDGTTQTLATDTNAGWIQAMLDTSLLANGDSLQILVQVKTLTGSTYATVFDSIYSNIQAEPVKVTPTLYSPFGFKLQMKLVAGTNRNIDWSVNRS